ncbi:MAG: hypothetical protein JST47_13960 [Bacteroidetes bacterium]|nr:hypothetical protein [Bacteroidota bacterium]
MMAKKNSDAVRSTGFSLLFAANPFVNIVASFSGGGDIAYAMKMVFESPNGSNRHFVSIISLLIVLLLAIPPIIRAFQLLKSKRERLIIIPAFLILPNFMKLLVVSTGMNFLLKEGFFQEEVISGAPLLVLIWLFVLVFLLMINYKSVLNFIKRKEWYGSIRV